MLPQTALSEPSIDTSEARLRDLLALSSDWLWEMDANFRFTQLQGERLSRSGIASSTSVGKCRWELDITGVSDEQWREHKALLERHEPFHGFVYQYVNTRGEPRWLSIDGMPFEYPQGRFAGYRGIGRDITAEKNAELALRESEMRLRAMLDLSSDWYWEQDSEYRLTLREGAILHKMGLPPARDLGKRPWEMGFFNMTEQQWGEHRALLERREEFRDQLLGRRTPDGREVWGRFSGRPRFNAEGHFLGYYGVGRGVTDQVQAERARKNRETEVALLFENAPASIVLFDDNLDLQLVNGGYERLWKTRLQDVVGKNLRELVGNAAFNEIGPLFNLALQGIAGGYRRTGVDGAGNAHIIDVTVAPNCDADGTVRGVYGIAVDATERIHSKEALHNLETLFTSTFQNTSDLMAIYRVEGEHLIIEGFNRALMQFYEARYEGVKISNWMGQPIEAFLREVSGLNESDTHVRLARFWEAVQSGNPAQYQTDLPTPLGMQRRNALLIPILNASGKVSHLFYRGTDITDLLRKEQELQAVNAGLERKVEERTVALMAANRELEAFAYSVSHDLRAPLRGIDGYSKVLGDEFEAQLGPTGSAYLTRIRKGIQRMGTLIDDLLQLSRVTRAAISHSLIDVSAMATEVAQEIAQQVPTRQVRWQIAPDIRVAADPGLMRLLLENLLGNAFKYSRDKPIAEISLQAIQTTKGCELVIRDNGIGFDMAYAAKLFQPFQRLHSPREFEGTGIGLATVSRIMARHGGFIEGRGEPGKGAEFRLVFPAPGPEAAEANPPG